MRECTTYACSYCDEKFASEEECREHERTCGLKNWSEATNEEIIEKLETLRDRAYGYHINNMVLGERLESFEEFLDEVRKRFERVALDCD